MMRLFQIVLLALSCIPIGCEEKKSSEPAADEGPRKEEPKDEPEKEATEAKGAPEGAASPEEAFAQLKKGANERDYRAFFRVLHRDSQNMMLAGQMMGAAITLAPVGTKPNPEKKKELDAIFEKYGVEDDGIPIKPGPPAQMIAAVGKKLEGVEDRAGLFHDLMLYLEKNSLAAKRPDIESLKNLDEKGDKATGTIVMKDQGGRTEDKPVEFRREGKRWYIVITKWG